jgi:hypothetical protein
MDRKIEIPLTKEMADNGKGLDDIVFALKTIHPAPDFMVYLGDVEHGHNGRGIIVQGPEGPALKAYNQFVVEHRPLLHEYMGICVGLALENEIAPHGDHRKVTAVANVIGSEGDSGCRELAKLAIGALEGTRTVKKTPRPRPPKETVGAGILPNPAFWALVALALIAAIIAMGVLCVTYN